MSTMDKDVGDTLALVNVFRQAFGAEALTELPDARMGNSSDCLYARALQDVGAETVSGGGGIRFADDRIAATAAAFWGTEAHGNVVQTPEVFARVINRFDNGELEQYNL